MYVYPPLDTLRTVLIHVAPGMPPDYWWVTAAVLGLLALSATVDAFTALVPDFLIFLGMLAVTGTQALFASWSIAGLHLLQGIEAGLVIWGINFIWFCSFRRDALGMGDAKWTVLAVTCFGALAGVYAWGIGAVVAVSFMLIARVFRYQITQITFAPFLLIGLCSGLFWLRFTA